MEKIIIEELQKMLVKLSFYEIHGWLGTSFTTSCMTYVMLTDGATFYSVLAGLGALFAGSGTAYYYIQKAKLIRKETEYIEEILRKNRKREIKKKELKPEE